MPSAMSQVLVVVLAVTCVGEGWCLFDAGVFSGARGQPEGVRAARPEKCWLVVSPEDRYSGVQVCPLEGVQRSCSERRVVVDAGAGG